MQKTDHNQKAASAHRKVQTSTTLNRRFVKKPAATSTKIGDAAIVNKEYRDIATPSNQKIQHFDDYLGNSSSVLSGQTQSVSKRISGSSLSHSEQADLVKEHPINTSARERMRIRTASGTSQAKRVASAKEIKEREIQKAISLASQIQSNKQTTSKNTKLKRSSSKKLNKVHFGFGRVMLALSCAVVAVFAIVYFVNLNMPDLSLRVAAMQTGIEASYPLHIPRDYALSDITSEDGKVTLVFYNSNTHEDFSLVEENSSWDSNALLNNYVVDNYGDNYITIREQGLTIYVSGSDACWVNGGVVFKLTAPSGSLTKKQITMIATSL